MYNISTISLSHSVGYINHTVKYINHSVGYKYQSVEQRNCQEKRRIRTCPENFAARHFYKKKPQAAQPPEAFYKLINRNIFSDVSRVPDSVLPSPYGAGNAEWFLLRR